MKKNRYIQPSVESASLHCTMVMQTVSNPSIIMGNNINDGEGD